MIFQPAQSSAAFDPSIWTSFFSTLMETSATLTGLLGVALSINLRDIIANRHAVARAAKALLMLAMALVICSAAMVPLQGPKALGIELLVIGALAWPAITWLHIASVRGNNHIERWMRVLQWTLVQTSVIPVVLSAGSLLRQRGGGLYWVAASAVIILFSAIGDTWVLMVEILR